MNTRTPRRRRSPRIRPRDPPQPPPKALSGDEVGAVLQRLSGAPRLVAELLSGAGLRLEECLRLRLGDVDLAAAELRVGGGGGRPVRTVPFPRRLKPAILGQMRRVRELHRRDLRRAAGRPPSAPGRRKTAAARLRRERDDRYLFPDPRVGKDPERDRYRRRHLEPGTVREAVRAAARRAGLGPSVGCRALRRACVARLREAGYDRDGIRALLGRRCGPGACREG